MYPGGNRAGGVAAQRDVTAEIHAAIDQVRTATPAGVVVQTDISAPLPRVFADGARINQALVQLLCNALSHTHAGSITVCAAAPPALDGAVRVRVADTGLGMTEREIEVRRGGPRAPLCS